MMQQFYGLLSRRVLLGLLICLFMATASPAADLYWNAPDGGPGPWNLTDILWSLDNLTNTVAWTSGDNAIFGGTSSGTVTIATGGVGAGNLTFNRDGYIIDGDPLNLTGAPTVTVTNAADTATISAVVSQPATATPNPNTFTKSGAGKLVISNPASVIDGRFTINAGEVVFAGSHTYTDATSPVVGIETIGNSAANAILTLESGAVFNSNIGAAIADPGLIVGRVGGSAGLVRVKDGSTLNVLHKLVVGGSWGAFNQTGGTVTVGGQLIMTWYGGQGVFNQSGGTFNMSTDRLVNGVGTGDTGGGFGLMNLSQTASFTQSSTISDAVHIGEAGASIGVFNISDSATFSVPNSTIALGILNNAVGTMNLMGGTVSTRAIIKGSGSTNSRADVNFHGGTLKAAQSNTTFMEGLVNTETGLGGAFVYSGGAKIDDGGFDVTIAEPLKAPTGNGVSATGLTVSGGGYIDTPLVSITNDPSDLTGYGATAVATIDGSGTITGIVITNPGVNYTLPPTFALLGGGIGNTGAIGGAATLAANTSGGLTKTGTGTLRLTGTSTYTGATVINQGALDLSTGSIAGGVNINGADAKLLYNGTGLTPTVTVTYGTIEGLGTINTVVVPAGGNFLNNGNGSGDSLNVNSLTFSGTSTVNISAPEQYTPGISVGTLNTVSGSTVSVDAYNTNWFPGEFYLINYTSLGGTGGLGVFQKGTISNLSVRQSATLKITTPNYISLVIAGDNPEWTGFDATTSTPNGNWTTSTSLKNWKLITEGTPTYYIEGDIARFDDDVSGTTTLSISAADVTPANVVFDNAYLSYTINGPFAIAGTGSLSVINTGSVTLNTSNSYSGGTTVSLGTLTLAGANTTSGATTLNSGTLNINNANALGIGALRINGGTIDSTSGSVALATTNTMNWNGDFAFGGTNDLDLGVQNNVALSATCTITANDPLSAGTKLIVRGVISGTGFGINKAGPGKMVLSGVNTYSGVTTVNSGTLEIAGGSIGVNQTSAPNIQISPNAGDDGTLLVSNGTVYADRVIIGGNVANNNGGNGTLNQTGGTIYSREWFTVGSISTGTYNMSGGTLYLTGQNMEVGNFSGTTGTVNISGSAAIKICNSRPINLGANNNCTAGTINQNGGTITFYSDAGTTVGGTGVLNLGAAGTSSGLFEYYLNGGTLTVPTISRNASTGNLSQGYFYFNGGTLKAAGSNTNWMGNLSPSAVMIMDDGAYIDSNGFDVTISQSLWGSGNLVKQGNGTLTLSGSNAYSGDTEVTGGKLSIAGSLSSNVTVTNGTLDGIGYVPAAIVPDGTGGIIANGSGGSGTFTIDSLTFNGVGTMNLNSTPDAPSTPALLVTTLTTTPGGSGKKVTINASAAYWAGGQVYDLVQYNTLNGAFADFAKGTISNLTSRQTATLINPPGYIALQIVGTDHIVWTAAQNTNWTTTTPGYTNWTADGGATDFLSGDAVWFNDSAGAGAKAVEILDANVGTAYVKFDNNTADYTVSSSGGYGITSGYVIKSGTGAVTLNTPNSYTGGTTINAGTLTLAGANTTTGVTTLNPTGTLNINHANALGTGALTINGGTLGNTYSGGAVALTTNNALNLNADFTFAGPNNLNLGTGTITVGGTAGLRSITVNAGTLQMGTLPAYASGYAKLGTGTLNIGGFGGTTSTLDIQAGTVQTRGSFTLTSLTGTTSGTLQGTTGNFVMTLNNTADVTYDGIITDTATTRLGIDKTGTGKLTLTNTGNDFNGRLNIIRGTVVFSGTHVASGDVDTVANMNDGGATNALLILTSGSVFNHRLTGIGSGIGRFANDNGAIRILSGATLSGIADIEICRNTDAFGVLSMWTGSTNNVTGNLRIGTGQIRPRGIMNQYGGSTTVNGYSYISTMSQGTCVLNVSGGTYNGSAGGMAVGAYNSTGSYTAIASGTLNVSGTAAVTLGGTRGLQLGPDSTNGIGWDATVNLDGGTVTTPIIQQRGATTITTPTINLNGATIVASAASATFFTGVSHAYVYDNGVTFDDGGHAITVGQSLSAPAGSGVSATGLSVTGGSYLDTPLVLITPATGDTTGTGATAVATIDYDTGALTGIVMTNPGVNYTAPPTFTLLEGGAGNTGAISGTATLVANSSGNLTKRGTGTLTLSGTNTYGGNTLINAGTLVATYTASLPGYSTAGKVQVASGATVAAGVGGTGRWAAADVLALNNNATLPTGSFLGLDTTGGDFTYSNAITGSEGFKKLGTNKLTLDAINTYAGSTVVNNGTLALSATGSILDTSDISTTTTTATFQIDGGTHTVDTISGVGNTIVAAGSLTATSVVQSSLTIGAGAKLTIAAITGDGPLAGLSTLSAVPEPSTWALLLLAGLGLGIYWRRSR
jgi:fibronectin-binding autotransporter adhesin